MRLLVTSIGLTGHFKPLAAFIEAAGRRGDDLRVVVPSALDPLVRELGVVPTICPSPSADEVDPLWEQVESVSPEDAAALVDGDIFPRRWTAAMLPTVEEVCRDWQPDLVLRESCAYAGLIAALRTGVRHAQVGISPSAIDGSAIHLAEPALEAYHQGVLREIQAAPFLTRFPGSLDPSPFAKTFRYRDFAAPTADGLADWWNGAAAPLVYLTFGTVAGRFDSSRAAYRTALAAVAELEVRVLMTTGAEVDSEDLGPIPSNVHVESWVPQAEVFAAASAVVCHGGSGTTFGALAAGLPLVVIPLFADQPANAHAVAGAGAGIVVTPGGGGESGMRVLEASDMPRLREAIRSVLTDPSYRVRAVGIAAEMASQPTADDLLGRLLRDGQGRG